MISRHTYVGIGEFFAPKSFLSLGVFLSSLILLALIFLSSTVNAQWLDFVDETDTRLTLTSVATNDDEEKDFWPADLDKDGFTDVIVVRKEPFSLPNEPAKSDLLLMNEGGILVDRTSLYAPEFISNISFARDVYIGDFDGDTWEDVVIINTFSQQPFYYANLGVDGGGNWLGLQDQSGARFPVLSGDVPQFCAVWGGDVNGDTFPDLYFVNYKVNGAGGTAEDYLLINDGTGNFTDETAARLGNLANSAFGTAVQIEDMDNDGDLDVLKISTLYSVSPWNDNGLMILFNDGTGNFTNWQNVAPWAPYMFEVHDYNDDGMKDIFVVDDGNDYILLMDSFVADNSCTMTRTDVIGGAGGFGGNVHKGDLDLDGDMDIIVADVDVDIPPCDSGRRMAILQNNNGIFTDLYAGGTYDWADNSYDLSILDINNDGLLDFITGGCSGYGVFMSNNCDLASSSADYDLDGIPDACDVCPTNPDPMCAPETEFPTVSTAGHSIARQWNEFLLASIRGDFARPTVHARNLFHTSMAMWDAWALFEPGACTYLLGNTVDGFTCAFDGFPDPADVDLARHQAISYASYRILSHRFQNAPEQALLQQGYDVHMTDSLGYDINFVSQDYSTGDARALGNYIAQCVIDFGLQDGANEINQYVNTSYTPVNSPLVVELPGNPDITDLNRWQPLTLDLFIDQSGNAIPGETPDFLSPEWGQVSNFSLSPDDLTTYSRDGFDYEVYHDPGVPPTHAMDGSGTTSDYRWGFETVALWSSHLDPSDGVMWDISPNAIGNRDGLYPSALADYPTFYDRFNGGTSSAGHTTNPATGAAYAPNMVPRADYARVLAEFWADGPDSETPPGHWFSIFNYVTDHPQQTKMFGGSEQLDDLEWDVKGYFMMGGAMHDCAVAAWGIKGWYDYLRPVSAIRAMADLGQSSDAGQPSYHPGGVTLIPGYIELVMAGDALEGASGENIGKIKILAWRGHKAINNVDVDVAGVDWILAENWEPYQRPSFVSPPFAGYVSGHSTYSRAAAVVLELFTGDAYFPGGLGEFFAPANEFLVFEDGPSVDVTLQWATYQDAADESGLSRIWGGIHPPCDDIPGRMIGENVGYSAFALAESYFQDTDADGACDFSDAPCMGDLNNDGMRNVADLIIFLSAFGCNGDGCIGDFNKDGFTNSADLIETFVIFFGTPCE